MPSRGAAGVFSYHKCREPFLFIGLKIICPFQTYQDTPGQVACKDCNQDQYCPAGSSNPTECSEFTETDFIPFPCNGGTTQAVTTTERFVTTEFNPGPGPDPTSSSFVSESTTDIMDNPDNQGFNRNMKLDGRLATELFWDVDYTNPESFNYAQLLQESLRILTIIYKNDPNNLNDRYHLVEITILEFLKTAQTAQDISAEPRLYVGLKYRISVDYNSNLISQEELLNYLNSKLQNNIEYLKVHNYIVPTNGDLKVTSDTCLINCSVSGLSPGAWAGIGIGIAILVIILIFIFYRYCYQKRRRIKKYKVQEDHLQTVNSNRVVESPERIRRESESHECSLPCTNYIYFGIYMSPFFPFPNFHLKPKDRSYKSTISLRYFSCWLYFTPQLVWLVIYLLDQRRVFSIFPCYYVRSYL